MCVRQKVDYEVVCTMSCVGQAGLVQFPLRDDFCRIKVGFYFLMSTKCPQIVEIEVVGTGLDMA